MNSSVAHIRWFFTALALLLAACERVPAPAVTPPPASPSSGRNVWVVAIGVSHYPSLTAADQLEFADDDARAIAGAFGDLAGPGRTYRTAHLTTIVNDEVTVGSLSAALDGLSEMGVNDLAVVFLAGHGVKASGGDMVFLTSAGRLMSDGYGGGIGWDAIGARLSSARGRVLVLLDACHSGHMTREIVVPNESLVSSLAKHDRAGVLMFAAAKGGQQSFEPGGARGVQRVKLAQASEADSDTPRGRHGLFTAAVLERLASRTTDRDADGTIQVSELVEAVSLQVSKESGGLQTPWVARRELFGDFGIVTLPQ